MPASKKAVYMAHGKAEPDPWCLVCGVNLRLDGRSYVAMTSDSAEETRQLFVQVLGVQFQSDYASVNMCSKCERALKRISRYSGLESAQKEAKALKASLSENLKRKGIETTEASEADRYEVNNFKGSKAPTKKSDPLIEDEAEDDQENDENLDPNKMPFGLFKKKNKKEKKDKKKDKKDEKQTEMVEQVEEDTQPIVDEQQEAAAPIVFKEGTTLAQMAKTIPKKPEPVKDSWEEADGGYVPTKPDGTVTSTDNEVSQSAPQEKTDPEKPVDGEDTDVKKVEGGVAKTENSPLILKNGDAKESKLQDQQPGMLCCTIL